MKRMWSVSVDSTGAFGNEVLRGCIIDAGAIVIKIISPYEIQ